MKKRLSSVVLSASSPPPSRPNCPPEDPGGAFGGGCPSLDGSPAPDPVGFSPVRNVSGCWLPPPPLPPTLTTTTTKTTPTTYAAPKSSLFGSPPPRRRGGGRGCSSSVVTPPTEDDENDMESGEESPAANKIAGTTFTANPSFPAWGSSHRKSAATSLFEMDDDDSDSDGEFGNHAPPNVKRVGRHSVTCLAPPELVTSTTADSFDFSVVGWGTAGVNAGPGAAALGGNQKIGEANPSSLFLSPPSTPAAGGGFFPPSHLFGDDVVSPLAMASPLAERCDKLYKGKPAGEAPTAIPFPAFTPLEVDVAAPLPQEPPQKTSHKAVVEAPDSPSLRSFLLHTCRSLSHGDLRSSVRCPDAATTTVADNADASTTPSRRRLVMVRKAPTSASTSSRALTPSSRGSRRRLSGGTTSMTAAEAAATKSQAGTTGPVPSSGLGASTKKTRTLKVRSKDVASLVEALMPPRSPSSSEPPPTPSKSQSSPRGTDLRAVWDAFRKATASKAPSVATPSGRRSETRSGRGGVGDRAAREGPAPTSSPDMRVRSRSRSSSLRTIEAGGRARSRSSTRPTRSPSFRRKSVEDPDAATAKAAYSCRHVEPTSRLGSPVPAESKRRREPNGVTAPDPEVKPSSKPVRRSRSFGSNSSPGEASKLSRATSHRDLEKRLVGPCAMEPRRSSCGAGSQSHVADGVRRRRSSSRTPVPQSVGGEDVRNQRRKSSSASPPASNAEHVSAPPRRRSMSRSSDGSSGRHSDLAMGAGTTHAGSAGVPGPPDLKRTGSEAAREVGISNEQLRLLQSAGMRILPRSGK